ncbi:MAG: winged helix-turn-helix transcriptional regulator, partial [Acidobacteriota bacterium]
MSRGALSQQVRRFKALGHPARLRLAVMLADGELCVCQMTAVLGLAPSTVSAHLAELKRAGLVQERKAGRWVFYRLDEEGCRLVEDLRGPLSADHQIQEDSRVVVTLRELGPESLCRVGGR